MGRKKKEPLQEKTSVKFQQFKTGDRAKLAHGLSVPKTHKEHPVTGSLHVSAPRHDTPLSSTTIRKRKTKALSGVYAPERPVTAPKPEPLVTPEPKKVETPVSTPTITRVVVPEPEPAVRTRPAKAPRPQKEKPPVKPEPVPSKAPQLPPAEPESKQLLFPWGEPDSDKPSKKSLPSRPIPPSLGSGPKKDPAQLEFPWMHGEDPKKLNEGFRDFVKNTFRNITPIINKKENK